jgi:hypothetical protein
MIDTPELPTWDTATLLPLLRAVAGLPVPQISQFEDILLRYRTTGADGTPVAYFSYSFDQDGHSQYDQTLRFEGEASHHPAQGWRVLSMRATHIGDAAVYDLPPALRRPPAGLGD